MSPLDYLHRYIRVVEVLAVIGAVIAFAVWWHTHDMAQQKIGYDKAVAEYQAKLQAATEAAKAKEEAFNQQLREAQYAATQREQTIRTLAAAAGSASSGLRDTITNISRGVSTASADALRQSTTTLAAVLNDCQDRYRGMAEIADRHASDAKTLSDAWPK